METKAMTSATWLNCKMGLNDLLARYHEMLTDCVSYANDATDDKNRAYFIDVAKYWAQKYKGVIISINELNQY